MPDFNSLLRCGDYPQGLVTAVIDVPMGSSHKIEWDRTTGLFRLDRVDPGIFARPVNYGFIPQTLDEDGDELDILWVTAEPLPTGIVVHARILGVLNFRDGPDLDYKIVSVPADDRDAGNRVHTLEDLGTRWQEQITHHFTHYKDLQPGSETRVLGWGPSEDAVRIIAECSQRWQNQPPRHTPDPGIIRNQWEVHHGSVGQGGFIGCGLPQRPGHRVLADGHEWGAGP